MRVKFSGAITENVVVIFVSFHIENIDVSTETLYRWQYLRPKFPFFVSVRLDYRRRKKRRSCHSSKYCHMYKVSLDTFRLSMGDISEN